MSFAGTCIANYYLQPIENGKKMKNLINKFFKREVQLNYIITEYRPSKSFVPKPRIEMPGYEVDGLEINNDEMEIDNLYQKN